MPAEVRADFHFALFQQVVVEGRDGNVVLEVRITVTVLVNERTVFHDHDDRAG